MFILFDSEQTTSCFMMFTMLLIWLRFRISEAVVSSTNLCTRQRLDGSDDWVLWIFVISSLPTILSSRNPFLAVS